MFLGHLLPRVRACRRELLQVPPGVHSLTLGTEAGVQPRDWLAPAGLAPRSVSLAARYFQEHKACTRAAGPAPHWHGSPDSPSGLVPVCAAGSALRLEVVLALGLGFSLVPESSCFQLELHWLTPHPKHGDFTAAQGALERVQGRELTALQARPATVRSCAYEDSGLPAAPCGPPGHFCSCVLVHRDWTTPPCPVAVLYACGR